MSSLRSFRQILSNNSPGDATVDTQTTSTDWAPENSVVTKTAYPGLFNIVGYTSTNWNQNFVNGAAPISHSNLTGITYGNGVFVAITSNGGFINTSTDGVNLARTATMGGNNHTSIRYSDGIYCIPRGDGVLVTTTNLTNFVTTSTEVSGLTPNDSFRIVYGNGLYFVGSAVSKLATSTNLTNWTTTDLGWIATSTNSPYIGLSTLVYGAGVYLFNTITSNVLYAGTSTNGINWGVATTGQSAASVYQSVYGNGVFAVGVNGGGIYTSTNASNWSSVSSGTSTDVYSIGYGNGLYVYGSRLVNTGNNDTPILGTSTNSVNWTTTNRSISFTGATTTTSTISTTKVVYGTGVFVNASTDNAFRGVMYTSTNGANWTAVTSGTTSNIQGLSYLNGIFFYGTVGGGLSTSTNGANWTARTSGTSSQINAFAYGNGVYLFGANAGGLSSSTNGFNWTARTSGTSSNILSMTYGNAAYVFGTSTVGLSSSTNGVNWTARTSGLSSGSITGLVYNNGTFVYTYNGSNSVGYATSANGTTWNPTALSIIDLKSLNSVNYANGLYMIAGNTRIYTSTNTTSWELYTSTYNSQSSAYGANVWVFDGQVGSSYLMYTGTFVNYTNNFPTTNVQAVIYGNGLYVLSGSSGHVKTTTDFINFDVASISSAGTLNVGYYANGNYFLGSTGGSFYTSTNGKNYTFQFTLNDNIFTISYGSGYYALQSSTDIRYSTNSSNWEVAEVMDFNKTFSAVRTVYNQGKFISVGSVSTALYTYIVDDLRLETNVRSVAYGNGVFVLSSNKGTVLTTTNSTNFNVVRLSNDNAVSNLRYANGVFICNTIDTSTATTLNSIEASSNPGTAESWLTYTTITTTIQDLAYGYGVYIYGTSSVLGTGYNAYASVSDPYTWTINGTNVRSFTDYAIGQPSGYAVAMALSTSSNGYILPYTYDPRTSFLTPNSGFSSVLSGLTSTVYYKGI